jgi:beta-N-acetylhexosaminidase
MPDVGAVEAPDGLPQAMAARVQHPKPQTDTRPWRRDGIHSWYHIRSWHHLILVKVWAVTNDRTLAGQLLVGGFSGPSVPAPFLRAIRAQERAGAILFKRNGDTPEAFWEVCRTLADAANGLPFLLAVDQEGGRVARLHAPVLKLPPARNLAQLGPSAVRRVARALGAQLRAVGFTMDFAPVLDIHSEEHNPIIGDRAFGTKPIDVVRLALPFAQGLGDAGILCCGKHFPGHGATTQDSHLVLPRVDKSADALDREELVPFAAFAAAELDSLMTAHVVYPALAEGPATIERSICTDLLRDRLGYRGVLFSDDLEMKALSAPIPESAIAAILAGCDLLLVCSDEDAQEQVVSTLAQEISRSKAFRTRCEEAQARSLAMRRRSVASPAPSAAALAQALREAGSAEVLADLARVMP